MHLVKKNKEVAGVRCKQRVGMVEACWGNGEMGQGHYKVVNKTVVGYWKGYIR